MFGIFRRKTKIETLQLKYKSVMNKAYNLSKKIENRVMKNILKLIKY